LVQFVSSEDTFCTFDITFIPDQKPSPFPLLDCFSSGERLLCGEFVDWRSTGAVGLRLSSKYGTKTATVPTVQPP